MGSAGDACETPTFNAASGQTSASCINGELNADSSACKTVAFVAVGCETPTFVPATECKAAVFVDISAAACSNGGTIEPAHCTNGGTLNSANDGCETPTYTAAAGGNAASCADGELNADSSACKTVAFVAVGCKTATFTAADSACKATDFGDSETSCCMKAATPAPAPAPAPAESATLSADEDGARMISPGMFVASLVPLVVAVFH